jgi:hypothetical protein
MEPAKLAGMILEAVAMEQDEVCCQLSSKKKAVL